MSSALNAAEHATKSAEGTRNFSLNELRVESCIVGQEELKWRPVGASDSEFAEFE